MPVEQKQGAGRDRFTHLEALGRTLIGIAPWLELAQGNESSRLTRLALEAIHNAFDPPSPDFIDYTTGSQIIVDNAFLCQAFLHAPKALWQPLDQATKTRVIDAVRLLRQQAPHFNNWLLFAAIPEAFLASINVAPDPMRVDYALRQIEQWYVGGGYYKDGPSFHLDYYNSFVIHPMLIHVAEVMQDRSEFARRMLPEWWQRARRYAQVQERLISPDGAYPLSGRSITYRCGAFQHLAFVALRHQLPDDLKPGQVRKALTAVITRTLESDTNYDANGYLRIGLTGSQPSLGEGYISTGSLYLCTAAFLPLGLPSADPFWTEPDAPTTWERAWTGADLPADHD